MTKNSLRLRDYLGHILKAIDRIELYCHALDDRAFLANTLVQDAVIRNLEIIGEASRNIERAAPEFMAANPELPLAFAYDMRNLLAHGYYTVDLVIVWKTVERDLPNLREQIASIVHDL